MLLSIIRPTLPTPPAYNQLRRNRPYPQCCGPNAPSLSLNDLVVVAPLPRSQQEKAVLADRSSASREMPPYRIDQAV
jgi:hypothetical protein